jgi:hypothetical protein
MFSTLAAIQDFSGQSLGYDAKLNKNDAFKMPEIVGVQNKMSKWLFLLTSWLEEFKCIIGIIVFS